MSSRSRVKASIPGATILSLLIVSVAASNLQFEISFASSSDFEIHKSFFTNSKPFISVTNSSVVKENKTYNTDQSDNNTSNTIKALITSGDKLNNNYTFANIPDGLGAVQVVNGAIDVFVNHELENETDEGGFAKVSKLRLNQSNGGVIGAELIINGSEEYRRLCSASLVEGYGFEHPIFLTNEEVDDGLVLAIDAINGSVKEMPWLGKFSHENTIHVPYFSNTINKTVVLGFEDGEPTESEVYMYIANSPKDLLTGKGQLYVFGTNATNTSGNQSRLDSWDDIYFSNGTVNGNFIPLRWDYKTQNETDLDNEAISVGGFQFIRPEDGAMDKRSGLENILYMAETGSDLDENDGIIPTGANGQNWTYGRMYEFKFTDPKDPTKISFKIMMDGNDPSAPGFNVMKNPDNVDTSQKSLMINEDVIDANRVNAATILPYNITNNAKIIQVDLIQESVNPKVIAYVNQIEDMAAKHGDWESSGILDVSMYYGEGSWLVDVQAHTLKEGGQLLLMKIPDS
jgi:hypothetical protein